MALTAAIIVGVLAIIGLVLFAIDRWRVKNQRR
jgi:nitrate reductase gamma subunit